MPSLSEQNGQIVSQFSRQAESYGKLTGGLANADRSAAFAELIGARPDDSALDVCCGTGSLALDLAPTSHT